MRIESIKSHLKGQTIMSRKSTFSAAFASALAPFDAYSREAVAQGIRDLGQDPEGDLSCVYCGTEAATWDHVFSRVVNGEFSGHGHRVRNLVPCCRSCNERKGKRQWRSWLDIVAPGDAVERASKIEHFLSHAAASPMTAEAMDAAAPAEYERYREIRSQVFALMAEADALAVTIRGKLVAAASDPVTQQQKT
ncbi:HNH endonuclease [Methylobacterium oryzae]|uniref:HNH endonuclease n=1 Tax=Methylobacterium oryzae TaxID=334852 RepID=UPI002F354B29